MSWNLCMIWWSNNRMWVCVIEVCFMTANATWFISTIHTTNTSQCYLYVFFSCIEPKLWSQLIQIGVENEINRMELFIIGHRCEWDWMKTNNKTKQNPSALKLNGRRNRIPNAHHSIPVHKMALWTFESTVIRFEKSKTCQCHNWLCAVIIYNNFFLITNTSASRKVIWNTFNAK